MPSARGEVTRHGRVCTSLFDLLGEQENDLTAALGFSLARSSTFLARLTQRLVPNAEAELAAVRMETLDDVGRTDLEIETPDRLIVVEAKRGWNLPDVRQLRLYAGRVIEHGAGLLVTLSDCSLAWAELQLPSAVEGITLRHLSWSVVREDLDLARKSVRGEERFWLEELREYLRKAVRMTRPEDGWAYCVVLSPNRPGGGGSRTYKDFVVEDGVYFHPFGWGSGWPKVPPNFMAFRWAGKVQRVHRVLSHRVVGNLQSLWPDVPAADDTVRPHVVYQLGPQLRIPPLPSGKDYRAIRLWVLIDQLLVCDTLASAHKASEELTRTR